MNQQQYENDQEAQVFYPNAFESMKNYVTTAVRKNSIFYLCIQIWFLLLAKALMIVAPVLIALWIYFLPVIILKDGNSGYLKELLYVKILAVFDRFSFFGYISTYGWSTFGFHFFKRALYFCFLPGTVTLVFLDVFVRYFIFNSAISVLVVISSITAVYREKLPLNPTTNHAELLDRKRDISKPLAKMVLVIFIVYFTIRLSYPIFLNSTFVGKLILRFLFIPAMMTCCTSLQMLVIKAAQAKNIDYLIPMVWISNGMLKMWERIFTNGMFNSGDYASYIVATFTASLIEIISHVTYFQRASFVTKVHRYFLWLRDTKSTSHLQKFTDPDIESAPSRINDESLENEVKWLMFTRKKMIVEDISMELMMLFTVTFVLYFTHGLVGNDKVETIPTFVSCIIQLSIQVVFELISDVFGLYWTMTRHKVPITNNDIEINNRWFWVWFLFIFWQSTWITWALSSS